MAFLLYYWMHSISLCERKNSIDQCKKSSAMISTNPTSPSIFSFLVHSCLSFYVRFRVFILSTLPLSCVLLLLLLATVPSYACGTLDTLTLTVLPAPTPTIDGPAEVCVTVAEPLTLAETYTAYSWSTGGTTASIDISAGGTYGVTVTSADGCTGEASIEVGELPLPTVSISEQPFACDDVITLDAGAGFTAYEWSDGGGAQQTAIYDTSGTYAVTVTDALGCTNTAEIILAVPTSATVTIDGPTEICGNETADLQATTGYVSYLWNTGATTDLLVTNTAGTYSVTVTDANNCTAEASLTLTVLEPPLPILDPGEVCPGDLYALSVTNPPFDTYLWSTGETTAVIGVGSGIYIVTVTDADGCTGTAFAEVFSLTPPSPTVEQVGDGCDGEADLVLDQSYSTVLWSTGATTPSATVTAPGTYSVTVTNADGCEGTADIEVTFTSTLSVTIDGPATICEGSTATLVATSGAGATYSWSTGATTATIETDTAGTYAVTATDGAGCTALAEYTVTTLASPSPTIAGSSQLCVGSEATLSLSQEYESYSWSTGVSTPSILISDAGDYSVTVTDANGCTGTDTLTVSIATSLSPSILTADIDCGTSITLTAGDGYTTYLWSGGELTEDITVTTDGTYSVTVSDGTGCSGTATTTVTIPPSADVTIEGAATICAGGQSLLSLTDTYASVEWTGGTQGPILSVDTAGTYTVTITDATGCTASDTFVVSIADSLDPTLLGADQFCSGDSIELSVAGTYDTYLWSTGSTAPSLFAAASGLYSVTVSDASGCTGEASVSVEESPEVSPVITPASEACSGTASLTTEIAYAAYLWTTGDTTDTLTVSTSGTYAVTVTDSTGCTGTGSLELTVPQPLDLTILGATTYCSGSAALLTASTTANTYLWSTGDTTATISISSPGTISLTVTDAAGCTAVDSVLIVESDNLNPVIIGPTALCTGDSGTLSAADTYDTYLWSTGQTTQSIDITATGLYELTVTDASGCTGTNTYEVVPATIEAPVITDIASSCDGQATLVLTATYDSYLWSTGATTDTLTVLEPGTYTVTVTSTDGCTATATYEVILDTAPPVAIDGLLVLCDGASTTLSVPPLYTSISWSTGSTAQSITVAEPGIYFVEAMTASGCMSTDTVTVEQEIAPALDINVPDIACAGTEVIGTISGEAATLEWSTGVSGSSASLLVPFAGNIVATTSAGCSYTYPVTVDAYPTVAPSVLTTTNCDGLARLSLAQSYDSYTWSTGATSSAIDVSTPGQYTVTVTDENGCQGNATVDVVAIPTELTVQISGPLALCEGGSAALQIEGSFDSITWLLDGQPIATGVTELIAVVAGIYAVEVTNGTDCIATDDYSLVTATVPDIVISIDSEPCSNAPALLTLDGILPQDIQSYEWSTGSVASSLSVTTSASYSVTVTTTDGCSTFAETEVSFSTTSATLVDLASCDADAVGIETLLLTNSSGCDSIVTIVTELTSTPDDYAIDLGIQELQLTAGDSVSITVMANFQVLGLDYDSPYELTCADCFDPSFVATTDGVLTVTAFDSLSCAASNSLRITVDDADLVLPNIINPTSPDNNVLTITNLNPLLTVNSLSIYDRWGGIVFTSNQGEDIRWDGTKSGTPLTPGVYIYMVQYTHAETGPQIKAGDVTIVR